MSLLRPATRIEGVQAPWVTPVRARVGVGQPSEIGQHRFGSWLGRRRNGRGNLQRSFGRHGMLLSGLRTRPNEQNFLLVMKLGLEAPSPTEQKIRHLAELFCFLFFLINYTKCPPRFRNVKKLKKKVPVCFIGSTLF